MAGVSVVGPSSLCGLLDDLISDYVGTWLEF